jgi:hypothetical protein
LLWLPKEKTFEKSLKAPKELELKYLARNII